MDYVVLLSNYLFFDSIKNFFLFFCLFFFVYIFFLCNSVFFQIIITIIILTLSGVVLASYGLDFFSGFLLLGELPILLVSFLFFFKKNKLVFDSLYSLNFSKKYYPSFYILLFIFLFIKLNYTTSYFVDGHYSLTLHNSVTNDHRTDFFNYYYIYYVIYPLFVVLIGFLIFIVSYLVIAAYYLQLSFNKKYNRNLIHFSFLRKQNFLKQSSFSNKMSFFKRQGYDK